MAAMRLCSALLQGKALVADNMIQRQKVIARSKKPRKIEKSMTDFTDLLLPDLQPTISIDDYMQKDISDSETY